MEAPERVCPASGEATFVHVGIDVRGSAEHGIFHHAGHHDVFRTVVHMHGGRYDVGAHMLQCPGFVCEAVD